MNDLTVGQAKALRTTGGLIELVDRFVVAQDVKASSRKVYASGLRRFLSWLQAEGHSQPERNDILAYKRSMEALGLSVLSISNNLVAVRKFFTWTETLKLYPNVARGIKGGQRAHGFRKDCLTVSQVKELLVAIDRSDLAGKRDFALLNLLVRTGLRTIEVIRADVGDIRQEGGEAVLWIQGKGREAKDAFVLLTADTLRPIRDYLSARGPISEGEPLFSSISYRNRGQRLTTRTIRGIAKNRLRAIGLDSPRLTAHSFRHSSVTFALQAGASIQEAQAMARHSNINTTLIYAHNINRIAQAPERKIDSLLADVN